MVFVSESDVTNTHTLVHAERLPQLSGAQQHSPAGGHTAKQCSHRGGQPVRIGVRCRQVQPLLVRVKHDRDEYRPIVASRYPATWGACLGGRDQRFDWSPNSSVPVRRLAWRAPASRWHWPCHGRECGPRDVRWRLAGDRFGARGSHRSGTFTEAASVGSSARRALQRRSSAPQECRRVQGRDAH